MPSGRTWRARCVLETLCWSRYALLTLFSLLFFFIPNLSTGGFSIFALKDVESYDPILNPVLNREVRRTGGRVLITLGDQDIDLSPSFVIFLSTRDPTVG